MNSKSSDGNGAKQPSPPDVELLTPKEAAQVLKLSESWELIACSTPTPTAHQPVRPRLLSTESAHALCSIGPPRLCHLRFWREFLVVL